ncbi:MAG: TonB-dependent receptor [Vicinamibacterales bacterium]
MRYLAVSVAVLSLIVATGVSAQTVTGSMSGTVHDASNQVVPGANVTIVHENTGEERRTVTNASGDFTFAGLVPGSYTVRVGLEGFKPLEVKNHVVAANSRTALGALKLEVGTLSETISVTAIGETLDLTRTSHEAQLDLRQVANLSIRGRDPISLLKILPGVSSAGNNNLANDQETFGGSFATAVPIIGGSRGAQQTIYVDGINGGDGGGGGGGGTNFSGATNLDAIEAVQVQMSAYTAEYGLKGGAQVNYITKRGGSEYHGTLYTYQRDKRFNSINYFNEINNVPKPEYRYSTLGGTLGGPVPKLPRINENKDKLFFFYSVDDTRLKNPQILRRFMMPTELERRGDFSQTRTPAGALISIRDPLTNAPFPGNVIPANRLDPRGSAFVNMLPLPNASGSGFNFVDQEASIPSPRRSQVLRVDYRPTIRDTISVKAQSWFTKSVGINVAGASARWGLVRQRYDFDADQGKLDYTRLLGTNTVLEVGTGLFDSNEDGPPENDAQLARMQRSSYPALAALPQFAALHNPLNVIPKAMWGNFQSSGSNDWIPNVTYDNRWPITGHDMAINAAASLTHNRDAHTFKFGVMRERENFGQARSGLYAGEFNFQNDAANPDNTGFAFSNALLGVVTTYTESLGRVGDDRRQTTYAWYAQDTWKVRHDVTLDVGLRMYKSDLARHTLGESSIFSFEAFDPRWSGNPPVLYRPINTADGRRGVNPLTGAVVPATFIGQIVPGTGYSCGVITPTNPCRINGVVPQVNGNFVEGGEGFNDPTPVQFDPRLGLAWVLNDKTVVRAAGGSFHEAHGGFYETGGPAYRFDRVVRYTDFNNYFTNSGSVTPGNVRGVERVDKRPNAYRYNIGVQRELGWHTVLDIAYVGDQTRYLPVRRNLNQVPAGARFLPENRDATVAATAANPGALPDVFLRPITGFGDIDITEPSGRSRYNSLQLQVTRRYTGGLELAGAYTWAKGRQNFFTDATAAATGGTANATVYSNNPIAADQSWQRSNIQEHVLVLSYTVDVPDVGTKMGGARGLRWLLDNWSVSGISNFSTGGYTGVTFTTTDNFDFTGGGERCGNNNGPVPNVSGAVNLPRGERTIDRWFNTDAFSRPTGRGDYGNNCDNSMLRLPGFHNHDISLFKNFPMRKGQNMQFRWEIYNLFDQLSFFEVDTSAIFDATGRQTDTNFGKVTSARNERRMQFSLRYTF